LRNEEFIMITYEAIHHVSIAVTDVEKAKHFYGDVLGLQEIERPNFDFEGAWYKVGNQQIHLIAFPTAQTLRGTTKLSSREGHFALRVADYDKTFRHLTSKGIEILDKRKSKSGFAQIFCADPDGNLIELNVEQSSLKKEN